MSATVNNVDLEHEVDKYQALSAERWNQHDQYLREEAIWLIRVRECLNRWAARYAESAHAKAHVKQTRLLIQELDERLNKLNR